MTYRDWLPNPQEPLPDRLPQPVVTDEMVEALHNAHIKLFHLAVEVREHYHPKAMAVLDEVMETLANVKQVRAVSSLAIWPQLRPFALNGAVWACHYSPSEIITNNHDVRFTNESVLVEQQLRDTTNTKYISRRYNVPTYGDAFEAFCESLALGGTWRRVFEGVCIRGVDANGDLIVDIRNGS